MSSLLNIGTQALVANQSALAYTGQNISNVNTEGYSRQRVNFETQEPPVLGVAIQDIERITDQFLVQQVWRDQSALSSSEQQAKKIELLDKLMVSDSTNLSAAMDRYFAALNSAVDDPLYIANRQLFLAEAQSLVSTFQGFDRRLTDQQNALTTEARSMVTSINSIASNIANLNVKISGMAAASQNYNALADERDELVKDLSSFISVDITSSDGGITNNVMLANGEPLISSGRAATLGLRDGSPDPLQVEVVLTRGQVQADVTALLGEGALGGLFSYRDEILQPTRNEIGRLALVFADSMNQQHRVGMDLDGNLGRDLFTRATGGQVFSDGSNKTLGTSSSLTFSDVSQLTGSDYQFEVTGFNSFRVTRLSDGRQFESSRMEDLSATIDVGSSGGFSKESSASGERLTLELDGFTLRINSAEGLKKGDSWLLKPTQTGARQFNLALSNPESLAFASPVRVTAAASNSGNAIIDSIQVLDGSDTSPLRPGQLAPPMEIVFNAPFRDAEGNTVQTYSVFDVTEPANPALIKDLENLLYVSGEPISFGENGAAYLQVTFANEPNPGDRFLVEYNTDGVSDNSNARFMADLQGMETSNGYSYQDAYGQLLAKVGSQANTVQVAYMSNQSVLSASKDALESVRGVNLDEEAAKLIQYQQAYTAATRLITSYQTIFDSLLSAVR